MNKKITSNNSIPPSSAWLTVFLPSLCYFLATRLNEIGFQLGGRSSSIGEAVTTSLELLELDSPSPRSTSWSSSSWLSSVLYVRDSETKVSAENVDSTSSSSCSSGSETRQVALTYPLRVVQGTGLNNVVATAWRHDEELGRGYLLVSDAHGDGRIWRWEVGGGPIAIGRTLHLDQSGCRSDRYQPCSARGHDHGHDREATTRRQHEGGHRSFESEHLGSGGIAIDFYQKEQYNEGNLVIAEWGEGRIVRLQEQNGARTPLVIQVPNVCHSITRPHRHVEEHDETSPTSGEKEKEEEGAEETSADAGTTDGDEDHHDDVVQPEWRRLERPTSLLYTPFGDLIFIDHYRDCNMAALIQLRYAVHAKPLGSLQESRRAHSWTSVDNSTGSGSSNIPPPQVLYHRPDVTEMGGLALTPEWTAVYVTVKKAGSVLLLRLSVETDDSDDDDDQDEREAVLFESPKRMASTPKVVFNLTRYMPSVSDPGSIAVDRKGHVFLAVPTGVLVVDLEAKGDGEGAAVMGRISTPDRPTSLTLGGDGFLYVSTRTTLMRIPVREQPIKVPTNVVMNPPAGTSGKQE